MTRVLLIDDEPLARSLLKEYLSAYPQLDIVGECADGYEGLKAIQQLQPDLIFLDIQMPRINGFEMLELLEKRPAVVFVTAFDEYAMRAFDTHAVDYLLKPVSPERLDHAVRKWTSLSPVENESSDAALLETAAQSPQQKERIVVKSGTSILVIPVEELQYLEAKDDYVKIHTAKGGWLKNRTMAHFEKILDPARFVRVHRSYIVNLDEITRLEPYEKDGHLVLLKSGVRVPVSKSGLARLREVLE